MSKFTRPRSVGEEPAPRKRQRPRRYPWLYDITEVHFALPTSCEACKDLASHKVEFEWRDGQDSLTSMFLCREHAMLCGRRGGIARVLGLIDRRTSAHKGTTDW